MTYALEQITKNIYCPVYSEIEGVSCLLLGSVALGHGVTLKVAEYYKDKKYSIPYITEDAGLFTIKAGLSCIKHGIKKLTPATGIILTIYLLKSNYLSSIKL